jgi:hypothetical protein
MSSIPDEYHDRLDRVLVNTERGRDHIDELSRRYLGEETYPNPVRTERVILGIEPEHVITFSPDG